MKEFDKKISQNRQQYLKMLIIAGTTLLLITVVLLAFTASKRYILNVQPENARITSSFSIEKGIGMFFYNKLYTLSETTKISIEAKKFIPFFKTITLDSPSTINILLEPKPSKVTATTDPATKETTWYLDNVLVEVGSKLNIEVKPGQHHLSVDSPFYQPLNKKFAIDIDEIKNLQLKLSPITGKIKLTSIPSKATIFIDDKEIGKTPLTIDRNGGRYEILIDLDGYEPTQDSIVLNNKSHNAVREYRLSSKKAYLFFQLQPDAGDLLIDGKQIANDNRVAISANQQHHILYQKAGFSSFSTEIKLKPDIQQNLDIVLQPQFGKVHFSSAPVSEVKVDGKSIGFTPITTKLLAVRHHIQFIKNGYRTVVKIIRPKENFKVVVNAILLTEFEARRKQRQATFAETIGIKMMRFKPDKVKMGSALNEPGRRRNEFTRNVEFTRPILISQHEISESVYQKFRQATANSQLPVSNVSWLEAAQFSNWLSEHDGLSKFYKIQNGQYFGFNRRSKGYRLPTEAEWEWLARKANRPTETIFVWGNSENIPNKTANFADESVKAQNTFYLIKYKDGFIAKSAIGSFKADAAGLFDLAGNVSEWVHDFYSTSMTDPSQILIDPMGPSRGDRHFYKGGNYNSGRISELRASYREPLINKKVTVGFRVARYQ